MIRFNSSQSFGTPSYWVQQLFPNHVGNRLVKTDLQWNIPLQEEGQLHGVYCNSTLDEKTNTLYTKIVNLCSTGTQGTLNLANGTAEKAEMVRLAGMSGEDENTMQYPNNIVPRPAKVQITEEGKQLTFPVVPFSVNIITTKLK